jgi:hypothetical protein
MSFAYKDGRDGHLFLQAVATYEYFQWGKGAGHWQYIDIRYIDPPGRQEGERVISVQELVDQVLRAD